MYTRCALFVFTDKLLGLTSLITVDFFILFYLTSLMTLKFQMLDVLSFLWCFG